ncbi:MAG: hypothetical protein QF536_10045 [Arenicellales bacterium]|nr:hypothetical protein [Arenicellales bacterium]
MLGLLSRLFELPNLLVGQCELRLLLQELLLLRLHLQVQPVDLVDGLLVLLALLDHVSGDGFDFLLLLVQLHVQVPDFASLLVQQVLRLQQLQRQIGGCGLIGLGLRTHHLG